MKNELGTTLFLVSLFLSLVPLAGAQATNYVQPMFPIYWTNRTILVSVPENPSWAKSGFEYAIQTWNQAQAWFAQSWEPSRQNTYYVLKLAQPSQPAQVTVQYVSSLPQGWQAATYPAGNRIAVVLNDFTGSQDTTLVAEHELGHVLGLADNLVSHDLMTMVNHVGNYPSTLNLYAAYLQAVSGNSYENGDSVSLSANIPYLEWQPGTLPLPEYPNPTLFPVFTLLSVLVVLKLRRFIASS